MNGKANDKTPQPFHFRHTELNNGNHFNEQDGTYKTPYNGLYHFHVNIQASEDTYIAQIHSSG